jgi:hypothetical protein
MGGYVQMYVTSLISSTVNFPVGTSTHYAPANVHLNTGSASGQVQVGVVGDVLAQGTSGVDLAASQPLVDATWYLNSSIAGNMSLDLQVEWSTTMEVNGFDRTMAYISHNVAGNWDVSSMSSATSEGYGMYALQRNGITSLSPFAVFGESAITSVPEISKDNSFKIYPNPVTDNIIIQNTASVTDPVNMEVFNAVGQLVIKNTLTEPTTTIAVSDLITGKYFIRFYNDKMSVTRSFIKM